MKKKENLLSATNARPSKMFCRNNFVCLSLISLAFLLTMVAISYKGSKGAKSQASSLMSQDNDAPDSKIELVPYRLTPDYLSTPARDLSKDKVAGTYEEIAGFVELLEQMHTRLATVHALEMKFQADTQDIKRRLDMILVEIKTSNGGVPAAPSVSAALSVSQLKKVASSDTFAPPALDEKKKSAVTGPSLIPVETEGFVPPVDKANLVMGMADNIHDANVCVFVESLRQFSDCVIVLFMDAVSPRLKAKFQERNVRVLPVNREKLDPATSKKYHPSTTRWILMQNFLKRYGQHFNKVLVADVRDTGFQSDPFNIVNEGGLWTFSESMSIMGDDWNKGWIRDCFGQLKVDELSSKDIICSGISLGTTMHVQAYLDAMSNEILRPGFSTCERNGVDQGIHNVIVHQGSLPGLHILDQYNGPVAHLQSKTGMTFANDVVMNSNNERAVIVHQYDRDVYVMRQFFRQFVTFDIHQMSRGTGDCASYTFKTNVEMFKGVGDLFLMDTQSPANTPEECCKRCDMTQSCSAFTHEKKTCWLKDIRTLPPPSDQFPSPGLTAAWRFTVQTVI
eukprot:97807-Hanusia_phi.AAC.2